MGRSLGGGGGISDLRQGLSFHKVRLRVLGQVTNRAVPRFPALQNEDATAHASAGHHADFISEPGQSP